MSDSIVLWRMCVVWNRSWRVLILGAALLVTTLGLNIANILSQENIVIGGEQGGLNNKDTEAIAIYGQTSVGLAAAFVSLSSNLCATVLVGVKAWYDNIFTQRPFYLIARSDLMIGLRLHSRHFPKSARSLNGRTMVQRLLELLVDSGVVYTVIWVRLRPQKPVNDLTQFTSLFTASAFLNK